MEDIYSFIYSPKPKNKSINNKSINQNSIHSKELISAKKYIENIELTLNEDEFINFLLDESKKFDKLIEPMLCLRCYVSYCITQYIKKLFSSNQKKGISLNQISLILLKDNGSKLIKFKKNDEIDKLIKSNKKLNEIFNNNFGKRRMFHTIRTNYLDLNIIKSFFPIPLGIEIILSYKSNKSSIKNWVFTKTRSDKSLQDYLKIYKVKIESKWTFLAYSSLKELSIAFEFYSGKKSFSYVKNLFLSYKKKYIEEKSRLIKKTNWEPNQAFLEKLTPRQYDKENLEDVIAALRYFDMLHYEEDQNWSSYSDKRNFSDKDNALIIKANNDIFYEKSKRKLNKHLIEIIDLEIINIYPNYLKNKFNLIRDLFYKFPYVKEIWRLWSEGYSTRKILNKIINIFPNCNQTFITRTIKEKEIYEEITDILIIRIIDKKIKNDILLKLEKAKNNNYNKDIYLLEERLELIKFFNPLFKSNEKESVRKNIAFYIKVEFSNIIRNEIKSLL